MKGGMHMLAIVLMLGVLIFSMIVEGSFSS